MQEVTFNYSGKNFVVVGASSGIGKQIALELAQAGANVLALARRTELIEQLKEQQGAGKIIPNFVDVTVAKPADWDNIMKNFVKEYGKISGGVYTAGVGATTVFRSWNDDLAQSEMNTSYWGLLRFLQAATRKRTAFDASSFVVFASTAGYVGPSGLLVYASAKAAVQTSVKVIARELGNNRHRVNSISPGWITNTGMTTSTEHEFGMSDSVKNSMLLGEGNADKVSGMVLFLLSDRADWITGTDIIVDGGQLLCGGGYE